MLASSAESSATIKTGLTIVEAKKIIIIATNAINIKCILFMFKIYTPFKY